MKEKLFAYKYVKQNAIGVLLSIYSELAKQTKNINMIAKTSSDNRVP